MGFAHPEYWIASAAAIPIILLYLLRPRPLDLNIPSLMFIMQRRSSENRLTSFLKNLVRDPLLLIQLLIILLLVTALLSPFYLTPVSAEKTIIVVDASASMQAKDVKPTRFDAAVNTARDYATGSVSIILSENTPVVVLRDGDSSEALRVLGKIKPKATRTNLGDSLILAKELAGDEGRIVVISDFSSNTGTKLEAAEKIAQENTQVIYEDISGTGENIGIINAEINDNTLNVLVKNYHATTKDINIKISSKKQTSTLRLALPPQGTGFFSIPELTRGITEITLPPDALAVDNKLYVSIPGAEKRKVLIVSDDTKNNPAYLALTSLPHVSAEQIFFETMPRDFNYDLVILNNYTRDSPLPGTFSDLRRYVEEGGSLVILFSKDLPLINTENLLPLKPHGIANKETRISPASSSPLVKDIGFGSTHTYLKSTPLKDATTLAESEDMTPIIIYKKVGAGYSIYLGVNENTGDFHLQPGYPLFWLKLLDWVSQKEDIKTYNHKTGTTLYLAEEQKVKTPTTTITTKNLLLDENGIYQLKDKKIAVNLLDEKESNITAITTTSLKKTTTTPKQETGTEEKNISWPLLILSILLLLLEIKVLSKRGET